MIFLPTFEINLSCQISLCLWRKNSDGSQDTNERTWVKCCSKVKCSMRQSSMLHPACKVFSRSPGTVPFRLRVLLCVCFFWNFGHSFITQVLKAFHRPTMAARFMNSWNLSWAVQKCLAAQKRQPTPVHHVPAGINAAVAVAHRPSALKGQAVHEAWCFLSDDIMHTYAVRPKHWASSISILRQPQREQILNAGCYRSWWDSFALYAEYT